MGKSPAFIVGFPRSGTTLVESILDAHKDVSVLSEESPTQYLYKRFHAREGLEGVLDDTDHAFVDQQRAEYWKLIEEFSDSSPKGLLIDKLPLNLIYVRLINTLFPDAKIIFVLRHPLDSCFSNFTQIFDMNPFMANLTTLDDAGTLYALSMSVWLEAQSTLSLNVQTVRYEDIVQDFDGSIRSLLDFLNLPWDESVKAFHRHAADKDVRTPSYEQVTQEIYKTSVDRWKNYPEQIKPLKDRLSSFIRDFGYDAPDEPG